MEHQSISLPSSPQTPQAVPEKKFTDADVNNCYFAHIIDQDREERTPAEYIDLIFAKYSIHVTEQLKEKYRKGKALLVTFAEIIVGENRYEDSDDIDFTAIVQEMRWMWDRGAESTCFAMNEKAGRENGFRFYALKTKGTST